MKRSFIFGTSIVALAWCIPQTAMAQTSPSAYTYAARYDSLGRVTGKISPDPDDAGPLRSIAVRTTYDAQGRPTKIESGELATWQSETVEPKNWTGFTVSSRVEFAYDANGRKIVAKAFGSDGIVFSLKQFSYDNSGRLDCTAVRMNPAAYSALPGSACILGSEGPQGPDRITKLVYDNAGQVVQIRKAVGTPDEAADVTYSYTPNGKKAQLIDANGNRVELRYDGFDQQIRWVFPNSSAPTAYNSSTPANALASAGALNESDYEQYSYDANGNRLTFRRRDGSVLSYTYDALNRVTVKTVPERTGLGATHTRDVYYSYDLRGLITGARYDNVSGEGTTTVYDGFGRISSSTLAMDNTARTLGYQYDADSNRTRVTYPDTNYATYNYDGLDRPDCIVMAISATCMAAPAQNKVASYTYNTIGQRTVTNGGISTSYEYDAAGRLNSLTNNLTASSYNNQWTFTFNPAGQISSQTRTNDLFAWTGHYNYDRYYGVNGLNQYTSAGTAAFCYDRNGNLTADGASVYLYDVENRMVEKRAQGSGNTNCAALSYSGALQASLRYDPMGRLYEIAGASGPSTRLLYDGDALTAEYDSNGTLLRRYIHGANLKSDDPIAWFEGSDFSTGNKKVLRPDWQGSIVLVADGSGNIVSTVNRYDEYGIPQSTNSGRFQYTGQAWVPELGMYYYKARIYSPTLGRFMQTDPIGYQDRFNLYTYAGLDPVNGIDPRGLYTVACQLEDLACTKAADKFEAARQENLKHKDPDVRAAAAAYGDPGQANGVTVDFASDKEMNKNFKPNQSGDTKMIFFSDGSVKMTVTFRMSLSGRGLQGTVAHEGSHVLRAQRISASFNPSTGKWSAEANITKFQGEVEAFGVQNKISREFRGKSKIEDHVKELYTDLDRMYLPPEFVE